MVEYCLALDNSISNYHKISRNQNTTCKTYIICRSIRQILRYMIMSQAGLTNIFCLGNASSHHIMFGLFVYTALCIVQVDLTKQFQTFYTDVTERYEVNPNSSELVFFFIQNTASWVTLSGSEITPISIIRPYTFAVKASASVLVETSSTTSVIVVVDKDKDCVNGAFYLAGGKEVKVTAARDITWWGSTVRYCMFSPSSEGQPVEVEFGMEHYSLEKDNVKMVYQRSDGISFVHCRRDTCSEKVANAYYYVSYQSGRLSASKLVYKRTNTHNEDRYTGCASRPISYYPGQIADKPYTVDSSLHCSSKTEVDVKAIVVTVLAVILGLLSLVAIILKMFRDGKKEMDGKTTSDRYLRDSLI